MKHRLLSPLSIEECETRFLASVGKYWGFFQNPEKQFRGEIVGHDFKLRVHRRGRNSFAPIFYGRFSKTADTGETVAEGHFSMHPLVKVFMAIWFTLASLGPCVMTPVIGATIAMALLGVNSNGVRINGEPVSLESIPTLLAALPFGLLFPLFGIGLVLFGKFLARGEKDKMLEFLVQTLDAHIVQAEVAG